VKRVIAALGERQLQIGKPPDDASLRSTSEAILQQRADYLSDSSPLASFLLRRQAGQTGVNAYAQTP